MQSIVAAVFCLFVLLFSTPSLAKDSITWMEVNMPPYMIQTGPFKDQGYGDVVERLIQTHLPEYEHHRLYTNVVRHFDMFRRGDKVCSIGLYRTPERESFLQFSIPSLLTMPAVLIIRADKLKAFGEGNNCSLVDLLRDEKFRLGFSKDRSYGKILDKELLKYADRANLIRFSGQELGENYFKMLMLDRLDALLGLPDEAVYRAEQMGIRNQIVTLMLNENQQNYEGWFCAIACPKNTWGKEVIDKINTVLVQIRPSEPYRKAYERWLDQNSLQRYRKLYEEVFLATKP
ncbi:MAG: TIGR02285 family protein [Desulfobulbus sp.]|nr:TIGR02285 family protein [Desulfobulbus sp.]